MSDDPIPANAPEPAPEPPTRIKRVESRLRAWWSAWKWVAILLVLLGLSAWGNLHQYGTIRSAKADCEKSMVEAAKRALLDERKRAAKADKQAAKITKAATDKMLNALRDAQEKSNDRQSRIEAVRTTGACRMPGGLPRLDSAVDAANAAAGN